MHSWSRERSLGDGCRPAPLPLGDPLRGGAARRCGDADQIARLAADGAASVGVSPGRSCVLHRIAPASCCVTASISGDVSAPEGSETTQTEPASHCGRMSHTATAVVGGQSAGYSVGFFGPDRSRHPCDRATARAWTRAAAASSSRRRRGPFPRSRLCRSRPPAGVPALLTSMRHRMSEWPAFGPFSSLKWTSTLVI